MKVMKFNIFVLAAAIVVFGINGTSYALHDGGVARCEACHTMHNSSNGAAMTAGANVGAGLTKGSDPSSTCLNCHNGISGGYHVNSTDGSNLTAGGDFYWLTKTFTYTSRGTLNTLLGENHGHNIIAADFGLVQDATLTQAPGGTYNAGNLGCTSCHDPHGKKVGTGAISVSGSYGGVPVAGTRTGNFRLLGDIGYQAGSGVMFTSQVPVARAFSSGNESNALHTDYGQNMSEWCSNCHNGFSGGLRHPAGNNEDLSGLAANYNSYVATGNITGAQATSYLSLVPFERGVDDSTTLSTTTTVGANASSNVMCLSCHRAHASAFPNAGRWDFAATFLASSHPLSTDGGVTGNDVLNSYYGRDMTTTFGAYQRSLCNKCHMQD